MIATDFSSAGWIFALKLDFTVAKRVQNSTFGPGGLLSRSVAVARAQALAVDSNCSPDKQFPHYSQGREPYGNRHGQVVQRREGLRVHHAGRRRRRPVRAFFGHSDERLQNAEGRSEGELRSHPGTQGEASRQHPGRLTWAPRL